MFKNKIYIFLIITLSILFYGNLVYCGIGNPNTFGDCTAAQVEMFQFIFKKFEISYDNGASYTTVWEGTQTVDICTAAGNNTLAGTIFSNLPVSEGTINKIRVTVGSACTVRGYVSYLGTTYKTTAGTNQPSGTGTTGAADSYTFDTDLTENGTYTQEEAREFVISSGDVKRFKMTFNLTNALGVLSGEPNWYIVPKYISPTVEEE